GLVTFAGCGTTIHVSPTNPSPRPMTSRTPASVEVYTAGVPDQPYVEVALLEAVSEGVGAEHVFQDLRAEAGRRGCEGLIIVSGYVAGAASRATCIMFREPKPLPPPPLVQQSHLGEEGMPCRGVAGQPHTYSCDGTLICRENLCVKNTR